MALPADDWDGQSFFLKAGPSEMFTRKVKDKEDIAPFLAPSVPLAATRDCEKSLDVDFFENKLAESLARVSQANHSWRSRSTHAAMLPRVN